MTYRGKVQNGVVVLDDEADLPEGTRVSVRPLKEPAKRRPAGRRKTLSQALLELAGSAGPGLPRDLARNHDHYLYGTPKRK